MRGGEKGRGDKFLLLLAFVCLTLNVGMHTKIARNDVIPHRYLLGLWTCHGQLPVLKDWQVPIKSLKPLSIEAGHGLTTALGRLKQERHHTFKGSLSYISSN